MLNAVGREIPEDIQKATGKSVFQGSRQLDGHEYTKASPTGRARIGGSGTKLLPSISDALMRCHAHDGMTISFHHHFREGDLATMQVMQAIHEMGLKDITLSATSLSHAEDTLVPMIEDGTITGIESSGVRGKIGEAISRGKLKKIAILRSHGGRIRAIETGETQIDIAFIAAPSADDYGNCRGVGGKSNCGVLSYAAIDAEYAKYVVVLTDCLLPFPNFPADISMTNVDYVVKVDAIGDPEKIATGAARPVTDPRKRMMAKSCAEFIAITPYFKDGFRFQTGIGSAAIATAHFLADQLRSKKITMGFGAGGMSKPMCDLFDEGLVSCLLDTQDFDLPSIQSLMQNPRHFSITTREYADPFCKGAVVNQLDFVILDTLEADVHFNCNVVVSSEGELMGAQGGHPDTAAGAKCTIVITPLLQGRIPTIRDRVTAVTTPGEDVDVIITDYGIAINPIRKDLQDAANDAHLPLKSIEELRDIAYRMAGKPAELVYTDRVVAIIEARDGSIMDIVRQREEEN